MLKESFQIRAPQSFSSVCAHGVAIDSSAPRVGESSLIQRCIDLQLFVGVSQLLAFDRETKIRKTPHCRHAAMARLFTTADTGLSGSHLWSTTPDIYQSDRAENRSGHGTGRHLARVMSPTQHLTSSPPRVVSPTQLALRSNDEYSGSFDVANVGQVYCQDCNTPVSCLFVCAGC